MSKIKTILSIIFIFTIWGCVSSAYPILLWWSRECVLYLIIIIKPEVWIINHCLGLGHETMVCAVCLTMFFWYWIGALGVSIYGMFCLDFGDNGKTNGNIFYPLHPLRHIRSDCEISIEGRNPRWGHSKYNLLKILYFSSWHAFHCHFIHIDLVWSCSVTHVRCAKMMQTG